MMNTFPIEPWGDRVMVERDRAAASTAGGIVLPERGRNKPARGTVLAVGPGRRIADGSHAPVQVKAGDTIAFLDHAGDEFKLDGRRVLLMSEADVLAVLSEE
jgi:chaperonin GroES